MANEQVQEEFKKAPEKEVKADKKKFKSEKYEKMHELISHIKEEFGFDLEPANDQKYKLIKAISYLEEKYDMIFNVINTDLDFKLKSDKEYKYFDDMDYRDMLLDLKLNLGTRLAENDFKTIIYSSKVAKRFNPFKDYLFSLPKWDGRDHISEFLQQVRLVDETKREYFEKGFKKWFVALVVSLLEDQPHSYYINQTCLVLVGGQGKYKTTFLKNIVPAHMQLKYYYGSTFLVHSKDHEKFLAYKMIINLDEMAALNKNDIESIKSRITQDQIVVRLPYAKADIHLKRRASFCGSVNNKEFLRDETGTRRFFAIEVDHIDLDEEFNVDLIYAQAIAMYKEKFQYWFDQTDIKQIELHNQDFSLKGFEEEYLLKYFTAPNEFDFTNKQVEYMSASDVADYLKSKVENININNTVVKNLGSSLSKNGFKKVPRRMNNTVLKLWAVKKVIEPKTYDLNEIPGVDMEILEELPI